jgi:hypothetical protein
MEILTLGTLHGSNLGLGSFISPEALADNNNEVNIKDKCSKILIQSKMLYGKGRSATFLINIHST